MSKTRTYIDVGKILWWAEQGLTSISLAIENRVDKLLNQLHKKDKILDVINKKENWRRQDNRQLAKAQDVSVELGLEKVQRENFVHSDIAMFYFVLYVTFATYKRGRTKDLHKTTKPSTIYICQ